MVDLALRGPLDAVPLLETFSLLAQDRRSGLLTLRSLNDEFSIHFEYGSVRAVSTNDDRLRIGQMLIQQGHVTEEQIEQALALQSITSDPDQIGEVLVDVGYLSEAEISQAVGQQIQFALVNLLRDRDGFFEFEPQYPDKPSTVASIISFEPLVLNATYLADRWLAEQDPERPDTVPDRLINLDVLDRLSDRERELLESLLNTYGVLHQLAWRYGRAAQQVKESIERLLHHVLLSSSTKAESPSQLGEPEAEPEEEHYVYLVDQPTDLWTLSDFTRNGRHLLLALLNGESRLSKLEEHLRLYTEDPERAIQELVSAGLVEVETGSRERERHIHDESTQPNHG